MLVASSASAQLWSPANPEPARFLELTGRTIPTRSSLGFTSTFTIPSLYFVWNSAIPYSLNDGSLWAGRGLNASLTAGAELIYETPDYGVHLVAAPTVALSQNRPFQVLPGGDAGRSPFASPWHIYNSSADLPLRFGDQPIRQITTGESTIEAHAGLISGGVTSASEWWGPGLRNAIVLGNNAAGIPRVFLATAHPVRTRAGAFDARLFLGTLTESPFFDATASNDYRSISGLLLEYRPSIDTTLSFGFARTVYRPSGRVPSLSHALDAIVHWETIAAPGDTLTNGRPRQSADQIYSLFGRWLFPVAHTEIYGEWARLEAPRSLREWFVAPQSTLGYTVGMQTAVAVAGVAANTTYLRVQAEATDLEQSTVFPDRATPSYYVGSATVQGYTQRGQIVGAAIGPGASSQWLAFDVVAPRRQAGVFIGRTRWENDVEYRLDHANATRHDVTIYSGLRGGWRTSGLSTSAQLTVGRRLNYLFQNDNFNPGEATRSAVDVQNATLEFQISR